MVTEEHDMMDAYDGDLLRRLLSYAKKHYMSIAFSLLLLILVVGLELIRPIILGQAVDEVIVNYNKTYSEVDASEVGLNTSENDTSVSGIYEISGRFYRRDEQNDYEDAVKATVVYDDTGYYFVTDLSQEEALRLKDDTYIELPEDLAEEASAAGTDPSSPVSDGTVALAVNIESGEQFQAVKMSSDEIRALRQPDFAKLIRLMIIFIVLLVAGFFVTYYQTILLHYTGQHIIYEIREEIFAHLQSRSVEFFNQNPVGRLVTRVTNDTETLNEMYTSVIVNSVKSVLTVVGIAVMMLVLNWRLSLATFAVIPLVALATIWFRTFSRKAYRDVRTKVSMINTFLSEHISGMKIVQIFTREKAKMKKFDEINDSLLKANLKQLMIFGVYRPSMYFIYILGLGVVLGYGGIQVIDKAMTIGVLVVFLNYISMFFDPIQQLAEQFNILQSAFASAEKIFSLLDDEQSIDNIEVPVELGEVEGRIEFKNVWFAYKEDEYVLKDINFTVEPGETVAFVGATGAGKTSILNLLSRYYEIQKGDILLDGKSIRDLDKQEIRRNVGQMLQDVFLFTGDITENIKLGDDAVSDDNMVEAAKYVNAHGFISKLPDQYKEHVYERGATFSAGQRQLLSFARTLAYDPKVLVLDEATANIDTETEVLIQDALEKLMKGRTTLVVAHRLSTIQHADKIVVLHKGRIREIGNHQELLNKKGLYYNLYQLQYQELETA